MMISDDDESDRIGYDHDGISVLDNCNSNISRPTYEHDDVNSDDVNNDDVNSDDYTDSDTIRFGGVWVPL